MPVKVGMSDSILDSVKKALNIGPDYDVFDPDVIMHINTYLAVLTQLGVGPKEGFMITGSDEEWSDFVTETYLNMVYDYVWLRVRIVFDPPTGTILNSMESTIKELEWRISVAAEEAGVSEDV